MLVIVKTTQYPSGHHVSLGYPLEVDTVFGVTGSPVNLNAIEKTLIQTSLREHGHNQSVAARALGVSRYALRYRMAKHGLR